MEHFDKLAFLFAYGVESIRTSIINEGLVTEAVISFLVLIFLIAVL